MILRQSHRLNEGNGRAVGMDNDLASGTRRSPATYNLNSLITIKVNVNANATTHVHIHDNGDINLPFFKRPGLVGRRGLQSRKYGQRIYCGLRGMTVSRKLTIITA